MSDLSPRDKPPIIYAIIVIIAIAGSGILMGITYFVLDQTHTAFEAVECDLPSETGYSTCQEWFEDTIYNLFNLKGVIIVFSYIFIFSLVIGLLVMGYKYGQNPVTIGIIFVMTMIFTYVGIQLSNIYRSLLENQVFYDVMLPMTIYNKVMLNFPWFVAIIGTVSLVLSVVNFQRARVNTASSDLNY